MSNVQQQSATTAVQQKNITDKVLSKIQAFEDAKQINLPKDYSAANALKAAWLILQEVQTSDKKPVLQACSEASIANALLKMVVWGLNPMKKQGDFIAYGSTLTFQPEYTGNIALAKRFGGLKWIKGNAVMEGDTFEFVIDPMTGRRKITKHTQTLESIGNPNVVAAYAVYETETGVDVEIMNKAQIEKAWNQGTMKGNSPAHKNFPDQMAIKTVINRACKLLIRSSDDAPLFVEDETETRKDAVRETSKATIAEEANTVDIGFAEEVVEPVKEEKPQPKVEKLKAEHPQAELFNDGKDPF